MSPSEQQATACHNPPSTTHCMHCFQLEKRQKLGYGKQNLERSLQCSLEYRNVTDLPKCLKQTSVFYRIKDD